MKQMRLLVVITCVGLLLVFAVSKADWLPDGAPVCTADNDQEYMNMISDGAGGVILTWEDVRGYRDIYAQRIDHNGAAQWTSNGIVVCGYNYAQYAPQIISDGVGGAIIAWYDGRPHPERDIYVQRVDAAGNALWTADGVAVCTAVNYQSYVRAATDDAKGAILTWTDEREGSLDKNIYAQRVDSLGNTDWTADGVAICAFTSNQDEPRIAPDGSGGAIITWMDYRSGYGIYAQRVDADGNAQWTANGVPIATASGSKYDLEIMSDGEGGAIIAWCDNRSGPRAGPPFASPRSSSGTRKWFLTGAAGLYLSGRTTGFNSTTIYTRDGSIAPAIPCGRQMVYPSVPNPTARCIPGSRRTAAMERSSLGKIFERRRTTISTRSGSIRTAIRCGTETVSR
jgi:hypothetical protein